MKPKTKIQINVFELSKKLKPITEKQKVWAYKNCLDNFFVISRKTLFCLDCGHSWKIANEENNTSCVCPACNKTLQLKEDYNRIFRDSVYFSILTIIDNYQVVRMFYASKFMKKLSQAENSIDEVMQHWINPQGEVVTMSKSVQGLSRYCDQWIFQSELEIRPHSFESCPRYGIIPYKIYPERSILPTIKRNGFKGSFYGFAPQKVFSVLLNNSFAETLLKTGQIELFKYSLSHGISQYWNSIKICIRNNYIVKDVTLWLDLLSLLKHFGKDLSNQKFVCPENLKYSHDKFVSKKKEQDKKIKLENLRAKIEAEQIEYQKAKEFFFDLNFKMGKLNIEPLRTIEEFLNEGEKLNHCLFSNEYYKKQDSLILSARLENEPIETIEISLSDFSILQARGQNNQSTKYHNDILKLVKSNMNEIVIRTARMENEFSIAS